MVKSVLLCGRTGLCEITALVVHRQSQMVRERIVCVGLKDDDWTDAHEETLNTFLADPNLRLLVAFNDARRGFCLEYKTPMFPVDQLSYFIKHPGAKEVSSENFLKSVQYGTVRGAYIESLLRNMLSIYAPVFFENTSWPDSILGLARGAVWG